MDEHEPVVMRQTTVALPFLDDVVPALYLADGRPSIPVFAVCHALGIPPASSIRRWRNLALWVTARKMLREQGELPIIDVVRVNDNLIAVEAFSMPLLPIVDEEDSRRFVEYRHQLSAWYLELAAFWHQADERSDDESQG